MSVTGSTTVDLLLALSFVLYLLYRYITNNDDFWDKRSVPNVKRGLLTANLLKKQSQSEGIKEIYDQFSDEKFVGFFQLKRPVLMVRDPKLINRILVKDFTYFQDKGGPDAAKQENLSKNLFGLKGRLWRALRHKLTPTFTTGKLRGMFEQVSKSGDNMVEKIEKIVSAKDSAKEVDPKNFLFEFTLDVISSCAFGVQFRPDSAEFNKFKTTVEKLFEGSIAGFLRFLFITSFPKLAERLNMGFVSRGTIDYFMNLTRSTMKYRKEHNVQRNDYFQLLMSLKDQEEGGKDMTASASHVAEEDAIVDQMQYAGEDDQPDKPTDKLFTEDGVASNTFIFLTAGSETVARTISFALFELSRHPDIQRKLQQEVDSVLSKHGGWSYEALREMTYLDQVIQESQRVYPALPVLMRECVRPYKVPDSDFIIEKGIMVFIPIAGLHKDPQHYPDPDKFDPDRFKDNNFKPNSTFLPFGDGPRICIAMRFAVMEVKACVARIMAQYSVELSNKTQLPLQFDVRSFILATKGGLYLSFKKRSPKIIL